ncbi:MAG: hypothetical protein ACREJO_02820 [Phycisphaerales bacterium]
MDRRSLAVVCALSTVAGASSALASVVGSDSAADAAYNSGWSSGSNGGTGFGPWQLSGGTNAGSFTGDSSNNGTSPSGNINTSGRAWGMYANSGQTSSAVRDFVGDMLVGQTFNISMDNGFIDGGSSVGLELRNGPLTNIFFNFTGGGTTYNYNGGSAGLGFTANGFTLSFTITSLSTFDLSINGGPPISGTLLGAGLPNNVRLFNFNAGGGSQRDAFWNSMAIVPTPGAAALAGFGLLAGARRRRV